MKSAGHMDATYTGEHKNRTCIHVSSEVPTYNPSASAGDGISCFRPRGHLPGNKFETSEHKADLSDTQLMFGQCEALHKMRTREDG
jgi:hypothetical protein